MAADRRLTLLVREIGRASGRDDASARHTLGELGIDSRHLVTLMMACDEIYGLPIAFEDLEFDIDTTPSGLHRQILAWLARSLMRRIHDQPPAALGNDRGAKAGAGFERDR